MLSAHRGAGAFRHDAAVSSWLHRIVVNACLDRLRRTSPTRPCRWKTSTRSPIARLRSTPRSAVQRALMRLPVEQRAAVVAVDMQGYSVADTARLLGVAEGTVKSRCARGRAGWPSCSATSTPARRLPTRRPAPTAQPSGQPRGAMRGHRRVHDGHWGRWVRRTTMRRTTARRVQRSDPPLTVDLLADLQAGLLDDEAAARVRSIRADPLPPARWVP